VKWLNHGDFQSLISQVDPIRLDKSLFEKVILIPSQLQSGKTHNYVGKLPGTSLRHAARKFRSAAARQSAFRPVSENMASQ
jgi:hypothetical protein